MTYSLLQVAGVDPVDVVDGEPVYLDTTDSAPGRSFADTASRRTDPVDAHSFDPELPF